MSEKKETKQHSLDESINLGMDQFGRFVKLRWIWLVLLGVVIWYSIAFIVPQLSPPTPAILLQIGLQISFALLFVGVQFFMWFYLMGRPRMYWVMPGETGVGFDDYKGNPEVLEAARRIVIIIQGVKEFQEMGGAPVRGLLLSGPPGTGKSYLAQCMSTEAGVPFGYVSAASLRGVFMGMDILAIRRLYGKARRLAREFGGCVIFMDELDAIGTARSAMGPSLGFGAGGMMGGGMGGGGLNQLLMEMDPPNIETGWFKKILRILGLYHGRVQAEPVLTIGATNIPDTLDKALLRPGRFDRQIHVAPPTDKYRGEVIEYYLNKVSHDPSISLSTLVARLVNYTPVAIKHIVNEAVIIAHFDGRDRVTYKDLVDAQDVHEYGLRQLSEMAPIDRRRIAYHEAGHTVAQYYLEERYFPAFVTIHLHGELETALAFAHARPKETVLTNSREDVLADIQISLAARASEELFLDINMTGVTGDLAMATNAAARYVGMCGMGGTLISRANSMDLKVPDYEKRVEAVLQSQFRAVKRLLQNHSEAVIAIAEALIERDELVAEEIKALIDEADARRVAKVVISDFEPLLGNGHSNGKHGNGYVLVGESGNGSSALLDSPHIDSASLLPPDDREMKPDIPLLDDGLSFFVDE
ncbi:MAG TPA: AAA family ATPase [Ktedonobacteraceae bacterium]|nr:AAA family ATPase [Ktedonobacteraceae bacterium]